MSPKSEGLPTSAYDYELPPHLIARHPAARRDESRLMLVRRSEGDVAHKTFRDLLDLIPSGDALVLNETKVFPARLLGKRASGAEAEILLLHPYVRTPEEPPPASQPGPGPGLGPAPERLVDDARDSSAALGKSTPDSGAARHNAYPEQAALHQQTGPGPRPGPGPGSTTGEGAGAGAGDPFLWEALVRPGAKLRPGREVEISAELSVQVLDVLPDGNRVVRLQTELPIDVALQKYGRVPLPPYIDREADAADSERYQTVYAAERGSVAAPTAGLHFTPELLEGLAGKGVRLVRLVLHVGVGTFRPVEVEDPAEHRMHAESYTLSAEAAAALNEVRGAGGAIWAVGTTVARTLETLTGESGVVHAGAGTTDIFIRPPYRFRGVDRLITNFHLPRSTLLMLVSAFGGYDLIRRAYAEAVSSEYRFYSYGDAMAIL